MKNLKNPEKNCNSVNEKMDIDFLPLICLAAVSLVMLSPLLPVAAIYRPCSVG
jgi:hypothetical protein